VAIDLGVGRQADPEISARLEVVKGWCTTWVNSSHEDKKRTRRAWRTMMRRIRGKHRWRMVCGPMAAIKTTMEDIGWKMPAPDVMIDPEEQRWEISGNSNMMEEELFDCIERGINKTIWKRAAKHWGGAGLEEGMDGTVIEKHLRMLGDKGLEGKESLMRKTAVGALWTRKRKFEAGLIDSPTCMRCKEEDEDEGHRFWRCPCNKQYDNWNIKFTENGHKKQRKEERRKSVFGREGLCQRCGQKLMSCQSWTQSELGMKAGKEELSTLMVLEVPIPLTNA